MLFWKKDTKMSSQVGRQSKNSISEEKKKGPLPVEVSFLQQAVSMKGAEGRYSIFHDWQKPSDKQTLLHLVKHHLHLLEL